MTFRDACKEFELDCKVRHLSPKTIDNYTKQLRYLENHLSSEFSILNIEDVKPAHIKRLYCFRYHVDSGCRKKSCLWLNSPESVPCHSDLQRRLPDP